MTTTKEFQQQVQIAAQDPDVTEILERVQALGPNGSPAQFARIFDGLDDETKLLALQSLAGVVADIDRGIPQ